MIQFEPVEFELSLEQFPLFLKDPDGKRNGYVIQELDGEERDRYLNTLRGRFDHGPDGRVAGLKSFDGLQTNLVSLSLHYADLEEVEVPNPVPDPSKIEYPPLPPGSPPEGQAAWDDEKKKYDAKCAAWKPTVKKITIKAVNDLVDVAKVNKYPSSVLTFIFNKAQEISKIGKGFSKGNE